jgi:hypothetical protein
MMPIQTSLSRIENAIIGPDLSSGIVKKLADLDAKFNDIVQANNLAENTREKKEAKFDKWKLAAVSFGLTLLGVLIKCGIDRL